MHSENPAARTAQPVVERPSDLTADWLTGLLGAAVADFNVERIGTGQMSECYREIARDWWSVTSPAKGRRLLFYAACA